MDSEPEVTAGPRVAGSGGVEIATYHLGGEGPPLMLAHATGFHGRCWLPLAPALRSSFSVWAVDHRGHGASGKAPLGDYTDWDAIVADMMAVLDAIGGDAWRGLGHSLGGAVLLKVEAMRPGTFVSLCCYEPVVMPPPEERPPPTPGGPAGVSLAVLARKRRPSFESRRAAYENYASKPPFARFRPDALAAYVEFGLVDDPDGGVSLACRREDEASVFDGAPGNGVWARLGDVRVPVAVLGGVDPVDPVGLLVDLVARRLPRGGAHRMEGLDHFGPFEDPDRVAAAALVALSQ